ncbi:hypothetical protein [Streptomyces sp. NPDC006645]|uniref:hypothetical protein n=1 Tax=unclassified Streptomyces TaxID=2593676 RepID=UPI0033AB4496
MAERVRPPLLVAPGEPTGPLVATGVRGPGGVLPGSVSYDGSVPRGGLDPRTAPDPTATATVRAVARGAAGRERVNAFRAHHFTALGCRRADSTR